MTSPLPIESIKLPETAPVMILPECNLLPHALLPLFIFEPRYRRMLEDSLSEERLFCMGMRKPGAPTGEETREEVFDHCTIGLIRASVTHDDGTSHLVLQGLRRVRILSWIDDQPYRIARIEPLESVNQDELQARSLANQLLGIARKLVESGVEASDQLQSYLSTLEEPEAIGDIVAYNFIPDPLARQRLIETADVPRRLRLVVEQLTQHPELPAP